MLHTILLLQAHIVLHENSTRHTCQADVLINELERILLCLNIHIRQYVDTRILRPKADSAARKG